MSQILCHISSEITAAMTENYGTYNAKPLEVGC